MTPKRPRPLEFRMTLVIAARPSKVWKALVTGRMLKKWYMQPVKLQLRKGGHWDFQYLQGKVLEVEKGRKLVHTFDWTAQGRRHLSRCTWLLEASPKPKGRYSKLTLIHNGFRRDRSAHQGVSGGWIGILSSLKTWMETGKLISEFHT